MPKGPGFFGTVRRRAHEHRYTILFYTLLLAIGLQPLARALHLPGWPIELLVGITLIEATLAVAVGRMRYPLLGLMVVAVGLRLVGRQLHWDTIFLDVAMVVWTLAALVAAAGAVRFMLRPTVVRSEHLYAALSAYLLVGLFFGVLYLGVGSWFPDAFLVLGQPISAENFTQATTIYYSFVTLATLGYGDIVPLSDAARSLSILEAVGGQLYLAVLVARLVGPMLAGSGQKE